MNMQSNAPQMEVQQIVAARVRDQLGSLVIENIRLATENEALNNALEAASAAMAEATKVEDAAARKSVKEKV